MLKLTRLSHEPLVINMDAIAYVESTPDTLVTLANGVKFHVRETVDEVIAQAHAYQHVVRCGTLPERIAVAADGHHRED